MGLSRGMTLGLIQGGADLGTALVNAYTYREQQKERANRERLQQAFAAGDAAIKTKPAPEFSPDIYTRTETDAFGNKVSVEDTRLPADISEQLNQRLLGDLGTKRRDYERAIDLAPTAEDRAEAQEALSRFLSENQGAFDAAQTTRRELVQPVSSLSRLSAATDAPQSSKAAQALQKALISQNLSPEFRSRVAGMLPELQDEAQAERDQGRIAQLRAGRQAALAIGDAAKVAQFDQALAEYRGAFDDATVGQQLFGGLPAGHEKAFDVNPLFGGTGLAQAIEQDQFLQKPFEDQYKSVLGGAEPTYGTPSQVEQKLWSERVGGLSQSERVGALQAFAAEREAGGNVNTYIDKQFGAEAGRRQRVEAGRMAMLNNRLIASREKTPFRLRYDMKKSNGWGAYEAASAKARASGLSPAQSDFVGAYALHTGHTPQGRDLSVAYRLARASSPAEFYQAAKEAGYNLPEVSSLARLREIYGLSGKAAEVLGQIQQQRRSKAEKEAARDRQLALAAARATLEANPPAPTPLPAIPGGELFQLMGVQPGQGAPQLLEQLGSPALGGPFAPARQNPISALANDPGIQIPPDIAERARQRLLPPLKVVPAGE